MPDTAESFLADFDKAKTAPKAPDTADSFLADFDKSVAENKPFTDDEKIAYMKRLYPSQEMDVGGQKIPTVDPGSAVLSPQELKEIYDKYKAEPWNVAPDALSPEFTRRTTLAAFDKAFGGRSRADVDAAMDRHAPKVTTGEQAQFVTGQVVSGMNAPALGYARRLFGPGGVLENPDSMAAAENVADPSRASLGDRYARVRADMESTAAKRTLVAGAHLAGATPGLILSGKALSTPTVMGTPNPLAMVVPPMAAGPTVLGLQGLAASGGDVAAAGEGVMFGALAGAISLPLQRLISRFPPAMQSALVDRAMTMGAGGAEFFTADAILHGPERERGAANFLMGMLMKAAGATPGQARVKELTTSTATYPDPVRAAAEVRGGYDRALAEAEASKPAIPAIDPVAEARATAAQFDARVAPESVAPEKPVSVAPVAPVEAAAGGGLGVDVGPVERGPSASFKAWRAVFQETLAKTGDVKASFEAAERQHPGDYRPAMTDAAARALLAEKNAKTDAMVDDMVHLNRLAGDEKGAASWEKQREAYREKNRLDVEEEIAWQETSAGLARDLRGLEATHGYLTTEIGKEKVRIKEAEAQARLERPAMSGGASSDAPRQGLPAPIQTTPVERPRAEVAPSAAAPKAPRMDPADVATVRGAVAELSRRVSRFEAPSVRVNVENFLMVGAKDGFIQELRNSEMLTPNLEAAINRMSSAKIAEIEAKRGATKAPKASVAEANPEAPKSKALIGVDKQGKQVWEIAGRFYVKDKAGRYGTAHPEAVKEARANAAPPVEAAAIAPRPETPTAEVVTRPSVLDAAERAGYPGAKEAREAIDAIPDSTTRWDPVRKEWTRDPVNFTEVEARPIEAAPEAIKTLTRGESAATEMFAGGPEAISTKAHSIWTGLRDTAAEGVKALRTFFSSQKSPELLAESPKAWRHVVAADAAPSIAKEAFGVWKSEVPDRSWTPQDAAKFEAALTENNRLGAIDARRADAARKIDEAKALRSEAAKMGALQGEGRSLALARATTMVKSALRLEREAKVLTERAYRAESKDEYLYGPGKPFTSRQELQEFVTRPDVVEAAKRHAAWWKEMVEPRYKASIQADDSVAMPGRGRFFDARASLVAERGESPVGGAGLVAGRTENLRVRKSRFAKTAFGDAAQGYKTAAEDYIPTALTDVIPKGEWRAAIDTLVKEGKAVRLKEGQEKPDEINGEKAMPFDIGAEQGKIFLPKRLHDMLYRIRQTGVKESIPVITAIANKATSEAMAMGLDNIFHIFRSMGVTMTRPSSGNPLREAALETVAWPVMRLLDGKRLLRRVFTGMDPRGRLEMAESGVAERGDSYRRDPKTGEVMIGPDGKPLPMESNIYGLRWLGKLGDAMDRAGRQELFDVIRRMKAAGVNIDTSPEAISKFVGQMGRYGRAWYGPTQQWVSDTGLNRFFEAWRNARGNAGRTLTFNSALTPKDAKTAAKLRLVMLSKLAGMFTTAGIINTLTDGSPFGKSDVPVGAIVLKRDEKTGRATTIDFFKMFGIRQVMNALGITAAIDAARTGGTVGQAATNASRAFRAELTRPFSGPLPTAVSIGITGSRPDQVARNQGDAMVPAAATEGGLLRRRAVEATKALFPLHAAVAETGARVLGMDQIRDILNIGEEVTPDMVDEMSEMLRTFSVGRTIGADKTDSLPERSKMGYLFGTYVDAVKEDIRKAPPEKIEAVMSKAFADIEARDDLDNGTKARLKKVIQMYAIGRQRGR